MSSTTQLDNRSDARRRTLEAFEAQTPRLDLIALLLDGHTDPLGAIPQNIYWGVVGLLLGYPRCCVTDFIARGTKNGDLLAGPRPFQQAGFTPCRECSAAFASDKDALKDIINQHRFHTLPAFPVATLEDLKRAYDTYLKEEKTRARPG